MEISNNRLKEIVAEAIDTVLGQGSSKQNNDDDKIITASETDHQNAVNLMRTFMDDEKPKVGIFWHDYANNSLFGVEKGEVENYANQGKIITYPKLHKTYWQKQHYRAVTKGDASSRFYQEHNYTMIPRGRIFFENGKFYVNVGTWINGFINGMHCIDKQKLRELIADEFDIPEDFEYRIDHHWDIGRGWSKERF